MRNKGIIHATASSSTAHPVPAGGVFEVFLSFCGNDTRKGFTDFLYMDLVGAGIQTFIDNEDLKMGEEIGPELLKAINESKISIPIFSQNYATSKWCLLELQQMVECHENQGQMIYPIFYDVDPSDVRNQSGSYKMAFSQHKENFSQDTVQKWRKALRVVGEFKGLELKKETDGRQGKLVKLVVEKVLLGLKKNYTHLPENLVGMDNHIEELTRLLQVDSKDVRVVGILGMGGLGKTTIAKVIYNRLCEQFEGQCFLDEIREKSKHYNGMVDLQKQLISNINRRETSVFEVNEGKKRINDAIRGKKLLIVLDDVDEESQVKMLMGDLSGFGQQSRIILTTRNRSVLDVIESTCERENPPVVYRCYRPNLLDFHHSLQLFSKYSFNKDSPLEGYDTLSQKVVVIAAGLPLVLVVLGSRFYAVKDHDLWEENLMKLQKIPNKDVMEKLKFSFDELDYTEQQIFLDIACLFIGYRKTRASFMWEDCGFYPRTGISVLVSRSLVTVGDDDILRMHDQLRDLGRQIVNEEGSQKYRPGEQSRLWCPEKAMQVLETHQGTSSVNALCLESHDSVGASHFHHLPNLRYLCINNIGNIDGDFKQLLPSLRWFECRNMRKFSPNNLNMKNLVVLHLSSRRPRNYWDDGSQLIALDDWDGWNQLKMANKLKVLDLSNCEDLRTLPNLSNLTNLVELCLNGCDKLTEIPGLQKLESLQVLNLHRCQSLETLQNISNLKELKVFNAFSCIKLTRIEGLPKLISLNQLNLEGCFSMKEGLGNLSNLNKLQVLVGAPWLDTTDFSNFKKLNRLEIFRNNRMEIQNLDGLEVLEYLTIHMCPSIERLPNLTYLKRLKYLWIANCEQLTEIKDLGELKSLELMYIRSCSSLKLIEIESRSRLESLKFLRISHCISLERLADLPNVGMLKELEVEDCGKLQEVEGLGVIQSLEHIVISHCVKFRILPNLRSLKRLKKLKLEFLKNITKIYGLEELKSLESLSISGCSSIQVIPNISNLQKLKHLDVSGCAKRSEIPGLEELKSLESLNISGCSLIEAIPNISNHQKLKHLDVSGCVKLSEIPGLGELKSLSTLRIYDNHRLQYLPDLPNVEILRY